MSDDRTILAVALLALLIVMSFPSAGASEGDEPDSTPVVLIDLESYELFVETDGTSPYELRSSGTVTAGSVGVGSNVQSIRVDLEVVSGIGYAVSIDPVTMIFPPQGGIQDFEWTMIIPTMVDPAIVTDTVMFDGRATAVPGGMSYPTESTEAYVEIRCSGLVSLNSSNALKPSPGSGSELPGYEAPMVLGAFIAVVAAVMLRRRRLGGMR